MEYAAIAVPGPTEAGVFVADAGQAPCSVRALVPGVGDDAAIGISEGAGAVEGVVGDLGGLAGGVGTLGD